MDLKRLLIIFLLLILFLPLPYSYELCVAAAVAGQNPPTSCWIESRLFFGGEFLLLFLSGIFNLFVGNSAGPFDYFEAYHLPRVYIPIWMASSLLMAVISSLIYSKFRKK